MILKIKVAAYKHFIVLISTMYLVPKATPTINSDYSCYIKL